MTPEIKGLTANPIVQALEKVLAEAKAGRINTFGIIMVDAAGNVTPGWAGGRLGDVYLGCGMMQFTLMSIFTNPEKRSKIVRVAGI